MRYTITSALPYANGPLHIGHIAGAYLPADIFVRYLRLKGHDVAYICGSDEHGAAITLQAKKENTTPNHIIDRNHTIIKKAFDDFGISFDIYHRTSSDLHRKTAQDFFLKLHEQGKFTQKTSEQYFDEAEQLFLADRYIKGTCPNCSYEEAYGDQCERCGTTLSPKELLHPKSMISGSDPILKETSHWYLPMNDYEDWLKEWIVEGKKGEWKPNVYGQCKSWIDQGLRERSMTRDLDWGIPVPLKDAEGKVLYVWLDAPIGYISATKQWCEDQGKDWKDYWQNEETQLLHFIGKDNIVFHCIIFPILLKAHGDYILPTNVPANEFLNLEGDKISTSRNWAVWLHEYLEELPGKEDVLRYVLTSISPETKDSEFTWLDYQTKNNSELVSIYGNLVNRVFVLGHKYFDGDFVRGNAQLYQTDLTEVHEKVAEIKARIEKLIESYHFREAQSTFIELARLGNKILTDEEPWKVFKEDAEKARNVLEVILQLLANMAILGEPFLPRSSAKLRSMLNLADPWSWDQAGSLNILLPQHVIGKTELLFDKVEDELIEIQIDKLKPANNQNQKYMPLKEEIQFDDFMKMDIRTGKILEAKRVEGADKLLQFKVELGFEQRTIVSGIAEQYAPDDLIGQRVSVLVNLAPRKIRGVMSQGMILLSEDGDGKLSFMESETEPGFPVN